MTESAGSQGQGQTMSMIRARSQRGISVTTPTQDNGCDSFVNYMYTIQYRSELIIYSPFKFNKTLTSTPSIIINTNSFIRLHYDRFHNACVAMQIRPTVVNLSGQNRSYFFTEIEQKLCIYMRDSYLYGIIN